MTQTRSDSLFSLLAPERLTAIVDVGANPIDATPPYQRMLEAGLCTIVGFEPQKNALDKLNSRKGAHELYLGHAIGDGRDRILHICDAEGMSSLLEPDVESLAPFSGLQSLAKVVQQIPVKTYRLDDISEIQHIDFLKIDCQGTELEVLQSGSRKLERTVAIQTEVSFVTLYREQPAFGAIDICLRNMGFVPHCFTNISNWPLSPAIINGDLRRPARQVVEADLVYVRNFATATGMDAEQWKQLAMIAHHCFASIDLALRAVTMATQIGALSASAPDNYLAILKSLGINCGRIG